MTSHLVTRPLGNSDVKINNSGRGPTVLDGSLHVEMTWKMMYWKVGPGAGALFVMRMRSGFIVVGYVGTSEAICVRNCFKGQCLK